MKIAGEYRIAASREHVWQALNDPEMLKKCIPGCESLEQVSDTELKAVVKAAVGPVRAKFNSRLTLENLDPPTSYTLAGESKAGSAGFGRGAADVTLTEDGEGTTLSYEADFKVGGKLAQVGSRLVAGATKKTADQFFGNLSRELDPGAYSVEIEQEEGVEAANAAMLMSRIAKVAAVAIVILLIAWFLLG